MTIAMITRVKYIDVMNNKVGLGLATVGIIGFVVACSARASQRNESCQRSADCAGDLVCVGGTCGPVNLGISPGSKQCSVVECTTADDCCTNPPCTNFACNSGKCSSTASCTADFDCNFPTPHCSNGTCVKCAQDSDCGLNQTCSNNECSAKCTSDDECPIFYGCQNNACVKTGCASDRECILYDNSEFASCDKSKQPPACTVKCENDSECGKYELCVSGSCVPAGCDTDDECKAILGPLPPGEHAVCSATP
jgi:hypothetical protein